MAVVGDSRASVYILLLFFLFGVTLAQRGYYIGPDVSTLPDLTIEVYKPKGIVVSGPSIPDLYRFLFDGNVNKDIDMLTKGTISRFLLKVPNGRLEFEDPEVQLNIGDVIHYRLSVSLKGKFSTITEYGNYTVTELKERQLDQSQITKKCYPTVTTVRGGKACGGQTIFEDDFSTLREDVWQIQQYIPVTTHPEHPFVSYENKMPFSNRLVYVYNGSLHIGPTTQNVWSLDELNFDAEIGFQRLEYRCTSRGEECHRIASGAQIIPPVRSGRLTSAQFAFKYGTVHVRAKLPQGDWLYPEILLEPYLKKYGLTNYASGVLKIAAARGNKELTLGTTRYDNGVLYGGPVMDVQCRQQLLTTKVMEGDQWGDDFHEYTLTWTPNYISLSVDGEEWAHVDARDGLLTRFPRSCTDLPWDQLQKGSKMAPFDDDFVISLGVAAGGITEFPDESYSGGGRPKPWRNSASKGMLAFSEDQSDWLQTWTQPELLIDYIKIVAL